MYVLSFWINYETHSDDSQWVCPSDVHFRFEMEGENKWIPFLERWTLVDPSLPFPGPRPKSKRLLKRVLQLLGDRRFCNRNYGLGVEKNEVDLCVKVYVPNRYNRYVECRPCNLLFREPNLRELYLNWFSQKELRVGGVTIFTLLCLDFLEKYDWSPLLSTY